METSAATKTIWKIDPAHSEVRFKVKHLVISAVTGRFDSFQGEFEQDGEGFENAFVTFKADTSSLSTNNEDRDKHLKSEEFFHVEEYPEMKFRSKSFQKTGDNTYKMKGDLTIKDNTRLVEFDVEHGGIMDDPSGNTKAGFEISGSINRKEFGLIWDATTDSGGVVVGDQVKLILNIQLAKE